MTKKKNEERSPWSTETAESTINSLSGLDTDFGESIDSGSPGRLSQSTEAGAGKRQIFAIGNFVNQR